MEIWRVRRRFSSPTAITWRDTVNLPMVFRSVLLLILVLPVSQGRADDPAPSIGGIEEQLFQARAAVNQREAEEEMLLAQRELRDWSYSQLRWLFAPHPAHYTRKDIIILKAIRRCLMSNDFGLARELSAALANRHRFPFPDKVNALQLPWIHFRFIFNPVGNGEHGVAGEPQTDSTFWRKPPRISEQSLDAGFGRTRRPDYSGLMLTYAGPKTGFGFHPGFEAKSGEAKLKLKFGEVHSEPFTARIFQALGYNVDPTDYAPALRLKYNRRFFREFNMRQELSAQINSVGGAPIIRINYQQYADPFAFIKTAVLRDGSTLRSDEFKKRLLKDPERSRPEDDPTNFNLTFEDLIDYLVTQPANVQPQQAGIASMGPWGFDQLRHNTLRELRGLGLLAAWVSWFDARGINTRLKRITVNGKTEYRHFLSDVGGGLGRSRGLLDRSSEEPTGFEWTFTEPPIIRGPGKMTTPFRVTHFQPNEDNPAFAGMTFEDARWMARLIAQITDKQLLEALTAAGFDSSTTTVYLQKLLNRRHSLIQHLGLGAESLSRLQN